MVVLVDIGFILELQARGNWSSHFRRKTLGYLLQGDFGEFVGQKGIRPRTPRKFEAPSHTGYTYLAA